MMRNLQLENAAEAAGAALNVLAEALEKETRKHSAVTVTFTPAKTMREAAAIAAERCEAWRIDGDTDGTRLGFGELRYACEEQDMQITFPVEESGKYYLVLPDGSIGVTVDGGANIEWIFLPA